MLQLHFICGYPEKTKEHRNLKVSGINGFCSGNMLKNMDWTSVTNILMLRLPIEYNKMKGQPPESTQNCDIFGS